MTNLPFKIHTSLLHLRRMYLKSQRSHPQKARLKELRMRLRSQKLLKLTRNPKRRRKSRILSY